MSDQFKIDISGGALKLMERLKNPLGIVGAIKREMDRQNDYTIARIIARRLNFPSNGPTTPDGLRHISGRLSHSIRRSAASFRVSGSSPEIVSAIGSNVKYAMIHEFGGSINRVVKDGSVRLRVNARGELMRQGPNGKLAIFAAGKHKRFKKVEYKGGRAYVINIPARAPVRKEIADRAGIYSQEISSAIINYFKGTQ